MNDLLWLCSECDFSGTEQVHLSFFFVRLGFIVIPSYLVTSNGRWKTTRACCLKGQQSVSIGGRGVRGAGRMGSRWRWFRPISTTEGGLKMTTAPPLPLPAVREMPYHLTNTISFEPPLPSSSSLTPNHTILDVESIIWILIVLKMRRTKIRFKTIRCDLSDVPRI